MDTPLSRHLKGYFHPLKKILKSIHFWKHFGDKQKQHTKIYSRDRGFDPLSFIHCNQTSVCVCVCVGGGSPFLFTTVCVCLCLPPYSATFWDHHNTMHSIFGLIHCTYSREEEPTKRPANSSGHASPRCLCRSSLFIPAVAAGFLFHMKILGECLTIHSLPANFYFKWRLAHTH